ncbi:MAG: glycoside hydrolase family 1 protein [Betaproteobacteria bacterium]|nr:glycoside hydrolase family 1 protein [Betaproteobacteria bacterium]
MTVCVHPSTNRARFGYFFFLFQRKRDEKIQSQTQTGRCRLNVFVKSILLAFLCGSLTAFSQSFSFKDPSPFVFGLATAPAHSEDALPDAWLNFAREGGVAAWKNVARADERLRFWSDPDVELAWAAASGAKSLRLGLDWGRLVPYAPGSLKCGSDTPCSAGVQDRQALERYKEILRSVRAYGLEPMVTLFHHSLPIWAVEMGGWSNRLVVDAFVSFVKDVVSECGGLVDEWITFNEPTVFSLLSDVARIWPPGGKQRISGLVSVPLITRGAYWLSLENMAEAHKRAYDSIRSLDRQLASTRNPFAHGLPARVGLAHNISYNNGARWFDWASARYFDAISKYTFTDRIVGQLDFLGINYYGQEVVKGLGVAFVDRAEYSESGRAVYPEGLSLLLLDYHQRYNKKKVARTRANTELKFVITENGVSDSTDALRGVYFVEHLAAVRHAQGLGVPVEGYYFWTLSDNWEWADGYCPKFGLLEVDRENNLERRPRPSFILFREVATHRSVSAQSRDLQWKRYLAAQGTPRPQCRDENGRDSLDEPRMDMTFRGIDFRFRGSFGQPAR